MNKNNLVFVVFSLYLFIPSITFAQLQTDSRCYTLEDCISARQNALDMPVEEAKKNPLYQGIDAQQKCGGKTKTVTINEKEVEKPIGFCYPGTRIETRTSFGGRKIFSSIGDFIGFIYRYGVMISGIVAVCVIIYAGLQYIMSGGVPEKITKAKERIGGALMGVFLVATSYIILNTINPYLVNLRLPQAWLINQQNLGPGYCSEAKKNLSLALSLTQLESMDTTTQTNLLKTQLEKADYKVKPEDGSCGNKYFIDGEGAQTCAGDKCDKPNQTCYLAPSTQIAKCYNTKWIGTMRNTDITAQSALGQALSEGWEWESGVPFEPNGWANRASIIIVCSNGTYFNATDGITIPNNGKQQLLYTVPISDTKIDSLVAGTCKGNVKGFVIALEMNEAFDPKDEWHYIGRIGGSAVDMGDKDAFDVTAREAPNEYFTSVEDLKKGIKMDIDAGNIHDIDDGDEQRAVVYNAIGFKQSSTASPTSEEKIKNISHDGGFSSQGANK